MEAYDVVVVGAGSAGCAAAGRLAHRTDLSVCLLEAGPDYGPLAAGRWPADLLDARRMPRSHDWGYAETRDGALRLESRARVVGGCSAHNQCAAVWGQPEDYDAWGVPGWSFRELEPLLREVDRVVAPRPYADDELASWQRAWLDASVAAGFPRIEDVGGPGPGEGAAPFRVNVRDGVRWSAAFAFLDPVRSRPNLVVRDETVVETIEERDGRVVLTCRGATGSLELAAGRCLLCAGAYGSPSILLRSGLGGPAVGENLHDHCGVRVAFRPSRDGLRRLADDLSAGAFRQSQACIRARSAGADAFDLHLAPFQTPADDGGWTFLVLAFLLAPRSRGRLRVDGETPTIDFGFLSDPGDEPRLEDALGVVRRIVEHEPLASSVEEELEPRDLGGRTSLTGYAHAVGTCALGSVVDSGCRVMGTENVFVADASIIPTIPRANPNLTCFLIGARVAELLTSPQGNVSS